MGFRRHLYAAGISGLILLLVVVLAAYIQFSRTAEEQEYLVEMFLEKPKATEKKAEEAPKKKTSKKLTHKAFNKKLKTEKTEPDNFQTLEEIMAERKELTSEEAKEKLKELANSRPGLSNLKKAAERKQQATAQAELKRKGNITLQTSAADKTTTITYSLINRIVNGEIPNPVYTCPEGGKVVINITVNATGDVVEVSPNAASSTTTNECLIGNALYYAKNTKFNANLQKKSQIGTITYLFQGK